MATAGSPRELTSLDAIRRQVGRWRETRPHPRSAMPDHLWQAAVSAARRDGLYATARTLRVDYGALKKHVDARPLRRPRTAAPAFVELRAIASLGADAATCVIEIETPHGIKRLRLGGLAPSDLLALAQSMWSAP